MIPLSSGAQAPFVMIRWIRGLNFLIEQGWPSRLLIHWRSFLHLVLNVLPSHLNTQESHHCNFEWCWGQSFKFAIMFDRHRVRKPPHSLLNLFAVRIQRPLVCRQGPPLLGVAQQAVDQ